MALAGASTFVGVNAVAGFIAFLIAAANEQNVGRAVFALTGVISAVSAFVGGWLLIRLKKPIPKGFGMGLMIGWALVTVCTAGICTAVNPALYTTMFGMAR
ncbi:hypothetical protein ACFXK0_07245 [Nocardia sp. NPDC059177]|uniref:hypothetical protein n=1 Tax=Nocardia sp. NPDC059177 TaxID=3346759 RepID=UPI0036BCF8C3